MKNVSVLLCALLLPAVVFGHHSRAEFTDEQIELHGVLTEVIWRNPHIALFLDVEADDGSVKSWRIEGWTIPAALEAAGISRERFKVGEELTVLGQASRFREAILLTNSRFADGTEALMAPNAKPYWASTQIGGSAEATQSVVDAAKENRGIFRPWHAAGNPMMNLRRFSYTDAAMAGRRQWDPIDNPVVRCEPQGMPGPLFHPRPIMFTRDGDDIELRHGYFDTQRTIHMDESLRASDQPRSALGFSQGSWEDERTLVVETSRVDFPYFDNMGTAQSNAITIVERYTLSEDQARLDVQLTIEDPGALTEPAMANWHYIALDQPYAAYECNEF